jgi:ABC-2 type transport system ATP-binding protein
VFLSSHLLSEVEQIATHVGVMSKGRLVLQDALANVLGSTGKAVDFDVDDPARAALLIASAQPEAQVERTSEGVLVRLPETAASPREIAAIKALLVGAGLAVARIAPQSRSLEEIYMAHVGARREESDAVSEAA